MRDPAFPLPPAEGVPNGEVGAMDLEQLQKEKQGLEQQLLERNKVRSSPQPFCPRLKALRAFRGFAGAPGTSWGCAQEKGFVLAFLSAPACVPAVLHTPVVSGPLLVTLSGARAAAGLRAPSLLLSPAGSYRTHVLAFPVAFLSVAVK